ncbi:amidohydrolase family protein [Shewanella algae]|nr:amidohydrolase family protein [Shewanella algae]QHD55611.1 amidohydrolase family protein [Shewanella algae]QXP31915.1 amidohydrolase family protein [Shewanella algae]QXP36211.1 amidohydrolase family protein [Shewanella algae]QXP40261.1 amidohydrolase family protein [Shewanella algae]UYA18381.1 amidohydrolase [Shewanella algae]
MLAHLLLGGLLLMFAPAKAHNLLPAERQQQAILLKNATVHTVSQGTLENTDVLLEQGVISAVGPGLTAENAREFDLSGKHLYPGLIALDTTLGLVEIAMARPTVDSRDVGSANPQLEAASAFNPDSELLPSVRANGITHAQIVPRGSGIAGQSALVSLDAWTIEDAQVPSKPQFHLYWPTAPQKQGTSEANKQAQKAYQDALSQIHKHFEAGKRYALSQQGSEGALEDSRWQALLPLYRQEARLFVHADRQQQIEAAIALARQYGFKLTLVGGYDAWRLGAALNEIEASVIYTHTLDLPLREDEPIGQAFRVPALLKRAGIPFALGFSSDWDSRNLPLAAGQTVAWGLSKEQALKAITQDAAKILGVDNLGAVAPGFQANIVVSSGDILDPMSSRIELMLIDGRQVDLNNRHRQLYQKYLKR